MGNRATVYLLDFKGPYSVKPRIFLVTLTLLIFVLFHLPARAWEGDFHYGLVKWLAVNAGFDLHGAELIAAGSEGADESYVLKATTVLTVHVCMNRRPWGEPSKEAARHVQRHHFPAGGFIPSTREKRKVEPGKYGFNNSGNLWVRQELGQADSAKTETKLVRFGNALHPLADSWSHQGISDKPPACPETLIWSHSDARGGWSSHDADLTHKNRIDAQEAAHSIFLYLLDFARVFRKADDPSRDKWDELLPHIRRFITAKNAREKREWFESINKDVPTQSFVTYPCFLREITLPGHNELSCFGGAQQVQVTPISDEELLIRVDRAESDPAGFVDEFLDKWLTTRAAFSTLGNNIEVNSVVRSVLGESKVQLTSDTDTDRWVETLFNMWLVKDHGLVNQLGHGVASDNFLIQLSELSQEPTLRFDSLRDAIHAPNFDGLYSLHPVSPENVSRRRYAVVFKFNHIPHDTITLIITQQDDERWKVTGLGWLPH